MTNAGAGGGDQGETVGFGWNLTEVPLVVEVHGHSWHGAWRRAGGKRGALGRWDRRGGGGIRPRNDGGLPAIFPAETSGRTRWAAGVGGKGIWREAERAAGLQAFGDEAVVAVALLQEEFDGLEHFGRAAGVDVDGFVGLG